MKRRKLRKYKLRKKREPLKYIAVLPSAITLMNGFFGFLAIIIVSHEVELRWQPILDIRSFSYPEIAAFLILVAMLADILDGLVARSTSSTSLFGAQLDSLCDAVSFGIAPAIISYKLFAVELVKLQELGLVGAGITNHWILFGAIIYAMCALVRLARFNVENDSDISAHMNFAGLPSPGAAGMIVSLVLFHEGFLQHIPSRFELLTPISDTLRLISFWAIPVALVVCGFLMVSRIKYPHLANQLFKRKQSFEYLIIVIIFVLFAIWMFHIAILMGFLVFVAYGFIRWVVIRIRKNRVKPVSADTPEQ